MDEEYDMFRQEHDDAIIEAEEGLPEKHHCIMYDDFIPRDIYYNGADCKRYYRRDELKEYDHVRIKSTGILGVIVDIYTINEKTHYTVESDDRGVPGGSGDEDSYKLFSCLKDEIELC